MSFILCFYFLLFVAPFCCSIGPSYQTKLSSYWGSTNAEGVGFASWNNLFCVAGNAKNQSIDGTVIPFNGETDGFLSCFQFDPDETIISYYSTYFGGNNREQVIDIDNFDDKIVIIGTTISDVSSFPGDVIKIGAIIPGTTNNAFVTYFNFTGGYQRSVIFGGTGTDRPNEVIAHHDQIVIIGTTSSVDFIITEQAYQKTNNGQNDGFIVVLDYEGDLVYSTYFGYEGSDELYGISYRDSTYYVVGVTTSAGINATEEPLAPTGQISNSFLLIFNENGTLLSSRFVGGRITLKFINIDTFGNIVMAGDSRWDGSIPTNPSISIQENLAGESDVIIMKFSADYQLIASTYFGGVNSETAFDLVIGNDGTIFIAGNTNSNDFPITDSSPPTSNSAFTIILTPDGSSLLYSSTVGLGNGESHSGKMKFFNDLIWHTGSLDADITVTQNAMQYDKLGNSSTFVIARGSSSSSDTTSTSSDTSSSDGTTTGIISTGSLISEDATTGHSTTADITTGISTTDSATTGTEQTTSTTGTTGSDLPITTGTITNGTCTVRSPVRCPDGSCVLSPIDCVTSTCPFPLFTCALNGTCVSSPSECSSLPCSTILCWDGRCVDRQSDCTPVPSCPPLHSRCPDGSCIDATTAHCTEFSQCGELLTCVDGSCVTDLSSCGSFDGCDFTAPILCFSGRCVEEVSSCLCDGGLIRCANGTCSSSCVSEPNLLQVFQMEFSFSPITGATVPLISISDSSQIGSIYIPPESVGDSPDLIQLRIKPVARSEIIQTRNPNWPEGLGPIDCIVSPVIDISLSEPSSSQFDPPVEIQLSISSSSISNSLCLGTLNEDTGVWRCQSDALIESNGDFIYATGTTTHFSKYAVILRGNENTNDESNDKKDDDDDDGTTPFMIAVIIIIALIIIIIISGILYYRRRRYRSRRAVLRATDENAIAMQTK